MGLAIAHQLARRDVSVTVLSRRRSEAAGFDLADSTGLDGVVCSPHELSLVRQKQSLLSITPGIRMKDSNDDQKRVMTPKEAIDLGADYLVIGRPITKSINIKKSLDEIYESIK